MTNNLYLFVIIHLLWAKALQNFDPKGGLSANVVQHNFDASGVRMYHPEDRTTFELEGASLVATRSFTEGEVLCSIPFGMCIMCHDSGAVRGGAMIGQQDIVWECAGDLRESINEEEYTSGRTWDINLAIALLDATCGQGLAGNFWESYTGVYP